MTVAGPFDAIVLAGGAARRLGGVDKPAVTVDGVPLLDRVLAACAKAQSVVVVGPSRPTAVPVRWTRESPPGGGPVPALAAGLAFGEADLVLVLAADLPFLDADAVQVLLTAAGTPGTDAAVYVDAEGRDQFLASAVRRSALRQAIGDIAELSGLPGARLVAVYAGLTVARVPDPRGVTADCDTWEAIADARRLLAPSRDTDEDGVHGRHS